MGIELTTLSVIGTDCIGGYEQVPYDHRHKSPRYVKICCVCLFMVCNAKYEKRLISSEIVSMIDFGLVLGLWCLTPLSTTFQIYHGG